MDNYYITLNEAADYLRVSQNTLRSWLKDPEMKVPSLKAGRKWLFRKPDLDAWLRSRNGG